MTGKTKMIIITSDEDIIHQFSFKQTTNTQIIDFDNNLTLLAELSGLNSNNDQVYKRAFGSSDDNRSKLVKVSQKSIDFICAVCSDRAIGFNYDVLSCASCKIFFRRNAHLNLEKLKCSTGRNQCSVAHGMRRKCQRCRLSRCFAMGMRKDFILSEEEKQRRRKRLEENRNSTLKHLLDLESIPQTFDHTNRITPTIDDDDDDIIVLHENLNSNPVKDRSFEMLPVEDWVVIQSVQSSFLSFFPMIAFQCSDFIDISTRISALISWSQFVDMIAQSFIKYFRQINEFEDLDLDDRFILIKYNMFPLFLISKCFFYDPQHDCCSFEENDNAIKHRRFFMLCGAPDGMRDMRVNLVLSLVELTKQDPTLLSLLSTILIFSQGLSLNENEPSLKDSLAVNRAQGHYTKILWNYLVHKSGEIQACRLFIQLLTIIFRIQSVSKTVREFFRVQCMTSDTVDRIAPIMQSILHIS